MAIIAFANIAAQAAFVDAALFMGVEYDPLIEQVENADDFTPGEFLLVEITEPAEARKVVEAITADNPPHPLRHVPVGEVVVLETPEEFLRWFGADDFEISHALGSLDASDAYGDEAVLVTREGNRLRFPAYPAPVDYVRRTVLFGETELELAYWNSEEWAESPQEVMGAILGSLMKFQVIKHGEAA